MYGDVHTVQRNQGYWVLWLIYQSLCQYRSRLVCYGAFTLLENEIKTETDTESDYNGLHRNVGGYSTPHQDPVIDTIGYF